MKPETIKIQISDIPTKTYTPILSYCRKLIKDGVDPDTILETYRGDVMCIRVNGIGKGAKLTVRDNKQGTPVFMPFREYTGPSRIKENKQALCAVA